MPFLLYGATGYTGALIAEQCAAQKLDVILAGRSEAPLRALAERLGLPHKVVGLDDASALDRALGDVDLVLHCAGPFARTSKPMVDACLRTRRHYLDITGEITVFETLQARRNEAKAAGVVVLPGVGFDVVPSDCIAAHAAGRMPNATALSLCIAAMGALSHGTASTVVENLHEGGAVRRGGRIVPEPVGARERTFPLRGKERACVSMPWGDVSTAFHSTKIPDITVYFAFPPRIVTGFKIARALRPVLQSKRVRGWLQALIPQGGPNADARARGSSVVIAEVTDGTRTLTSTLTGPEGYAFTVQTAMAAVARMRTAPPAAGTHTPSSAFGADFVLSIPNVTRTDDA
jgi:short subunit dehydrogenase-like uncharacterized protein